MKNLMFIYILLAISSCCPGRKISASSSDSMRVEVRERTVLIRDTVWRDFPLISETVALQADSSHLENRYATSDARISPDGLLYHSLATKPQKEAIPIDRPVVYRDSIVYRDRSSERVVAVEVERKLTWWQQTQIRGFWLCLALFAVMLGWQKVKSFF